MRRAAKVDATQAPIVAALQRLGAEVINLSRVGAGVPDLLVSLRGRLSLIEVKTGRAGKLTPAQIDFHAAMARAGTPVTVLRSIDDAIAWAVHGRDAGGK